MSRAIGHKNDMLIQLKQVESASAAGARQILGSNHESMVEEVVSEVRLRLIQRCIAARPPFNPPNWAWTVAVHYAKRMISSEEKYAAIEDDAFFIPDPSIPTLEKLVMRETMQALPRLIALVQDAIHSLQESDRQLYTLYYKQEYQFSEIAETLGITIVTARKRWYRLMKKISEQVRLQVEVDKKLNVIFASIIHDKNGFRNSLTRLLGTIAREGLNTYLGTLEILEVN